jgi:hypothetical protein
MRQMMRMRSGDGGVLGSSAGVQVKGVRSSGFSGLSIVLASAFSRVCSDTALWD